MLRSLIDPGAAPFCPLPHSNRDLNSLITHNWIIALELPRDLRSCAIQVSLAPQPNTPSQESFHRLLPQILGALCNAVVANTTVPWQTFTNAPDPVAVAVAKHLHTNPKWTGTATELLLQLLRRTPLPNITFQSHKGSRGKRSVYLQKIATPKLCADAPHPPKPQSFIRVNSCSFVAQAVPFAAPAVPFVAQAVPLVKIGSSP